jgi:hypothetical protein
MEENTDIETQQESNPDDLVDEALLPEEKPAALTLVIRSWATPIIGIVMLVVGLLGGYYIRPLLSPEPAPVAAAEVSTSSETEKPPAVVPTSDAERAAQQQELMTAVVERTRHFRGDPDAPITIIEFSDFQ